MKYDAYLTTNCSGFIRKEGENLNDEPIDSVDTGENFIDLLRPNYR